MECRSTYFGALDGSQITEAYYATMLVYFGNWLAVANPYVRIFEETYYMVIFGIYFQNIKMATISGNIDKQKSGIKFA